METQNLSTLKIHKLSQEQYLRELEAGNIDEYALYLTPSDDDISNKQDKLIGVQGQIVGFDENGNAVAQDAVQSDWNQNDETAADYVKNRPFYESDPTPLEIMNTTATGFSTGQALTEGYSYIPIEFSFPDNFEINNEYIVNWDGEEYICSPLEEELAKGNVTLGNSSIANPSFSNTGEPFCIILSNSMAALAGSNDVDSHSVIIVSNVTEIYKLDKKFLPDFAGLKTGSSGGEIFNDYINNTASGNYSHAEGYYTTASDKYSHAEGYQTTASGHSSHAEGSWTTAFNNYSHAEGYYTTAYGPMSHAEGYYTIANSYAQHVQGECNVLDTENTSDRGTYAHIVGNGTSDDARSNAHTLDWNGNAWFAGDVYVGSTSGINRDEGSKKLATVDDYKNAILLDGETLKDISGKNITEDVKAIVTPAEMTGSTSSTAGTSGLVPSPAAGDQDKFLKGDGTWAEGGSNATSTTVTLSSSSWTEQSDGTYAQTVSVADVTADNQVVVDCNQSNSDIDANIAILQGWGCVNKATQAAGSLTFYCYGDIPTVNVPINMVVM